MNKTTLCQKRARATTRLKIMPQVERTRVRCVQASTLILKTYIYTIFKNLTENQDVKKVLNCKKRFYFLNFFCSFIKTTEFCVPSFVLEFHIIAHK